MKPKKQYQLKYQDTKHARKYKDIYSGKLNIKNILSKAVAYRERSIIKKMLKNCGSQCKTLLDVPCGAGKLSYIVSDFSVVAADVSMAMISLSKESYLLLSNFFGFVVADIVRIPFKKEVFDIVICLRLFHRIPLSDREEILKNLAEVSNNYIIVSYGLEGKLVRFRMLLKRILRRKKLQFPLYLTTSVNMKREIQKSGLKVVSSIQVFPLIYHEIILLLQKGKKY
jgi:hypothetical protein